MFTIFIAFSMTVRCLELCRVIDNGNKEGNNESEIQSTNPKFPRSERESVVVVVVVIVIFLCNVIFAAVVVVVVVVVVLIIVVFVFVVIVIFIVIVIIIVKSPSLTSTN